MNKQLNHEQLALSAIKKKLLGKKLNYHEVFGLMDEISHRRLSDVLTTYFVAASFKEGFSDDELYYLTKSMVETGNKISFSGIVADKHSTGGVSGTRTTMIIVPIVAACGFKIPKLSSRAITAAAGTADVMEVLAPVTLTLPKLKSVVEKTNGCVVWNGAMGLAPADDIIIHLEEPLAFESFDKIIVSIMAKKVAVSTNHLILDIPVGPTMKIRHFHDADKVARKFKKLGERFNIHVETDVNETFEPAARGIGPMLEAKDVFNVLEQKRDRPLKLENKALRLAGRLLQMCYKDANINKDGEEEAKKVLFEGKALKKFIEIIKEQGGQPDVSSSSLVMQSHKHEIESNYGGRIHKINNYNINTLARILGSPHDMQAGIYFLKKLDEAVHKKKDFIIFFLFHKYRLKEAIDTLLNLPIYEIEK